MSTTTDLSALKINYLTQAQYNTALTNDEIDENELYLTPDVNTIVQEYDQNDWHVRKWSNGIVEEWTSWSVSGTFTTWSNLAYMDSNCPNAIPVTGTLLTKLYGGTISNMTTWVGATSTVRSVRFLTQGAQSGTKTGTAWLYLVYKT